MIYEVKNKLSKETIVSDIHKVATRNAYMSSTGFDFLRKYQNNEWITGYNVVDKNNPTETEKLLLEEKAELEKYMMKSLDETDPNNEFLLGFTIQKYNSDGTLPVYDDSVPKDLFTIRAALAGGSIAPNLESVGKGIYSKTMFYFESKEIETSKKKVMNQLKNKAGYLLEKNSSVREWLLCMAFKLGINVKPTYENDTLYNAISDKKDSLTTEKSYNEFIKTLSTPVKEIDNLFACKQGIAEKVIKYDKTSGEYLFESLPVGKTVDDVILFFEKDVNSELFNSLRKKVYKTFNVN